MPVVFEQLELLGALPRRGQVTMIAGAPGGGKSAFTSFWALNLDYTGFGDKVPGIYFSADSDKMTFGKAAVASVLGIHTNEAEKLLEQDDPQAWRVLEDQTGHLWVSFQAAPSPRDIREELDAFAYTYGDWPHFVVVDNLMDVDASGAGLDERTGQDAVIDFLKQIAKETSAAVIILCHVVGEFEAGDEPIPMRGLMNKVSKRPRLILTLHQHADNILGVSVVKNSGGRAKKDGSLMALVPWIPERAWFGTKVNR